MSVRSALSVVFVSGTIMGGTWLLLFGYLQPALDRQRQAAVGARVGGTDEMAVIVASRRTEIFDDPDTPIGGNPVGDVTLVEFFDYNCVYCRAIAPMIDEVQRSDPELRFAYKEWPILGFGSEFAARAALASRIQGKYLEFHAAMMEAAGIMTESKAIEIARKVGLDVERLKRDADRPEIVAEIEHSRELARALRITGTPSFVIGDQVIRGAVGMDVIRSYIREAREK